MEITKDNIIKFTKTVLKVFGVNDIAMEAFISFAEIGSEIHDQSKLTEKQRFLLTIFNSVREALYADGVSEDIYHMLMLTFEKYFTTKDFLENFENSNEFCRQLAYTIYHGQEKRDDTYSAYLHALKILIGRLHDNLDTIYSDKEILPIMLSKLCRIEKMQELFENIDGITKEIRYRHSHAEFFDNVKLPELQKNCSKLSYLSTRIGFYGRDTQVERIRDFLGGEDRIRIWCITGDGGVGKSKLARFAADALKVDCTPVWLDDDSFEKILDICILSNELPYHKTLLFICDYAGAKQEQVLKLIRHMVKTPHHCRLLLIERLPEWYVQFCKKDSIADCFWRESGNIVKALDLSECLLDDAACGKIVEDYHQAAHPGKKLTEDDKAMIIAHAYSLESTQRHRKMRCLYLMLTADAYFTIGRINNWNAQELVDRYIEHSKEHMTYPKSVISTGFRLLALATVLGGLNLNESYPEKIQELVKKIYDAFHDDDKTLNQFLSALSEKHTENETLMPLLPDIVGEFLFVQEFMKLKSELHQELRKEWLTIIFHTNYARTVLIRCLTDWQHEKLINEMLLLMARTHAAKTMCLIRDTLLEHWRKEQVEELIAIMEQLYREHPSAEIAATYAQGMFHLFKMVNERRRTELLNFTLTLAESLESQEQTDIAVIYFNIGNMYHEMGNFSNALDYLGKALKIRKNILGMAHPDTALTYNNIGVVYYALAKYDDSLFNHQMALKIQKNLDNEHLNIANSYINIGNIYWKQDKYQKALNYHRKALKIQKEILGIEHPDTSITYNAIGVVHWKKGEYNQALENYQQALKTREKVLGINHPYTATSYHNIGRLYFDLKDYETALTYLNKALDIFSKQNHPNKKITIKWLKATKYKLSE